MKKLFIGTLVVSISFVLITIGGSLLFAYNVLNFSANALGAIFVVSVCMLAISTFLLWYIFYRIVKANRKTELQRAIEKDRQLQLLSLYKRFGIPPQRKKNGDLMNFYELLGIEPQFDEFGERIPTIYELLNIFPKFDVNGCEIPTVLFIKNRATKFTVNVPPYLRSLSTEQVQPSATNQGQANKQKTQVPQIKVAAKPPKAAKKSSGSSGKSSDKFVGMITNASKAKNIEFSSKVLGEMFVAKPKPESSSNPRNSFASDNSGGAPVTPPPVRTEPPAPARSAPVPPTPSRVTPEKPDTGKETPSVELPIYVDSGDQELLVNNLINNSEDAIFPDGADQDLLENGK